VQLNPDALADLIVNAIAVAMKSHGEQIAAAEALFTTDVARVEGYTAFLQRDLAVALDRIAVLEARAPEPGPPGPPGPAGLDGAPGLSYCGVYVRGKEYDTGEIVTAGGSAFHCNRITTAAPGSSPDWTLMVKRGQDGKDGGRP
jgi:hypothetical protein